MIQPIKKPGKGLVGCVARAPPAPAPAFDCGADSNCAGRLGATHWNPCYYLNASLPVLLDGASSLAGMGSRAIKVAVFDPASNYPFNSPNWAVRRTDDHSQPALLTAASLLLSPQHPQLQPQQ